MYLPTVILFCAGALIQVVKADEAEDALMEKCRRPPPGPMPREPIECCGIEKMFNQTDFESCDALPKFHGHPPGPPPNFREHPKMRPHHPHGHHGPRGPPCEAKTCMFKNHNLLDADSKSINKEALKEYITEKWGKYEADFKPLLEKVKETCLGDSAPSESSDPCPVENVLHCVMKLVHKDCPDYQTNEECKKMKAHHDECKEFFEKKRKEDPEGDFPPPPPEDEE